MQSTLTKVRQAMGQSAAAPYLNLVWAWYSRGDTRNALYNLETVATMKRIVGSGSVCVDVGSHRGELLRHMIRLAPRGQYFAFEPLPAYADFLRARYPQARVVQAAVGDYQGQSSFIHVKNDPGYSGLRIREYNLPDPDIEEIQVNVVRLDDVIPETTKVAFIKIDVEGGEYGVLNGALRTIERGKPTIVVEVTRRALAAYGVDARQFYALLSEGCNYHLSTMRTWLDGKAPISEPEFCRHWDRRSEFYFIAYPKVS